MKRPMIKKITSLLAVAGMTLLLSACYTPEMTNTKRSGVEETLDDLDVNDVFIRCLDTHQVAEGERPALIQSYKETIASLHDDDKHAE